MKQKITNDTRKLLVLDTSVLLYDKESIHSFPGNDIIFPIVVLDELDRFKEKPGLLGEAARYVNRYLDNLRSLGNLHEGIYVEELDQTYKVLIERERNLEVDLDFSSGDNRLIRSAFHVQSKFPDKIVKVITKDINLRVKCDALGLTAEDYYSDHINTDEEPYSGFLDVEFTDEEIDEIYSNGGSEIELDLFENEFLVAKGISQGKSVLAVYRNKKITPLGDVFYKHTDVKPRNKEQKFALCALSNAKIPLVTLTGLAGSGKTFLTLMAAIEALENEVYERIVVTRSIEPVGKEIGFLPGDLHEKMAPWMSPLLDNFRQHFKDRTYFEVMMQQGKIEIAPLSFIRGRTFSNSFVIVDEAQNATIHELKTIVTRVGENSKVVLMGDTDQIDTPYIDKKSNGLAIVIERMKNSSLSAHVHLFRGERSQLATYASKVL